MKLPFKEPLVPRYVYVNPKTNVVHLLMPIMSGTEIGLDNTCKSVYSLQEFFGLLGANLQSTAIGMLKNYQEALVFDIKYHPDLEGKTLKEARLVQITRYLSLLQKVQQEEQITVPLKLAFPAYPAALESLMQANDVNLYSVLLHPQEQDVQLRTTAISPVFSANHDTLVNGQRIEKRSLLYETLSNHYAGLMLTPKSKEQLIELVLAKCPEGVVVNFERVKELLTEEIHTLLGVGVDFNQTQGSAYAPSVPVTQAYLDEEFNFGVNNPRTYQGYIEALIAYCAPHLFDVVDDSPFYTINNQERRSILTQFFLAELNITCREEGITDANFGQILEANPDLVSDLATAVKEALACDASVEDVVVDYVNQHQDDFHLRDSIPQDSIPKLKERFKSHYQHIKGSPHFDEFMLLSKKEGAFFAHQGCIATHFAHFMQTGFFAEILKDESTKTFLQSAQKDFATVDKPENILSHNNEHIHADMKEVELDLSKMDNSTLQALYEDINSYQDPNIKEALLAELKKERPDFKPQIDAKAFLQHVAYGEQHEAEALLNKDPELAQELLRASNIPFTDYAGRTFACTAYEYAYWAKDSHMQRMLENYIRQDEETRKFILGRVKAIEELVNPPAAEGFFAPQRPRGLRYTTQDKEGKTIEHCEAHFDLTPLKKALQHYVDEYKKPNKSDEDWAVLDNIWVKEVGMAQRDVPAHIAQEYCHPERSFHGITKNKDLLNAANPNNLKRQLKFYNFDTNNDDFWFTPGSYAVDSGLGFSFAILPRRGGRGFGPGMPGAHRWGVGGGGVAACDLPALTTIDEVSTSDLNQSLENLSQSLIVQAPQYPVI